MAPFISFAHATSPPVSPSPSFSSLSEFVDSFSSPLVDSLFSASKLEKGIGAGDGACADEISTERRHRPQISLLEALAASLRKSLVICSVASGGEVADGGATCPAIASAMSIGWPMNVRHVSHVTFDRFDGFLGLPDEMRANISRTVPGVSASIFGVLATSLHCSYDSRGNVVPTILLLMQKHLYSQGGLQAEGIFRINAENGQEVYARQLLNSGIVPSEIDVHCLAGLIKAWFRELPTGVLDSISPDEMLRCNTETECFRLVKMLKPTEAALLDWAINLMADVVEHEQKNKMNARNIAMVFAPNMTQMADPLTALIHAVQVMNFLKTLITKVLQERDCFRSFDAITSRDDDTSPEKILPPFPSSNVHEKSWEISSVRRRRNRKNVCTQPVFHLSKSSRKPGELVMDSSAGEARA